MSDGWSNRERNLLDRLQKQSEDKGAAKKDALAAKKEVSRLSRVVQALTD